MTSIQASRPRGTLESSKARIRAIGIRISWLANAVGLTYGTLEALLAQRNHWARSIYGPRIAEACRVPLAVIFPDGCPTQGRMQYGLASTIARRTGFPLKTVKRALSFSRCTDPALAKYLTDLGYPTSVTHLGRPSRTVQQRPMPAIEHRRQLVPRLTSDEIANLPVSRQRKDQLLHPDRQHARSAIHDLTKSGRLAPATAYRCAGCGAPAQEYDHYLGYEPRYWLCVQPVCRRCHAGRRSRELSQRRQTKAEPPLGAVLGLREFVDEPRVAELLTTRSPSPTKEERHHAR